MKSYTDIEQSKKLTKILPIESADMCYPLPCKDDDKPLLEQGGFGSTPCWSLAALLSVLPYYLFVNNQRYVFNMQKGLNKNGETYMFRYNIFNTDICLYSTCYYNNSIDACCEMIIKLRDLNLL